MTGSQALDDYIENDKNWMQDEDCIEVTMIYEKDSSPDPARIKILNNIQKLKKVINNIHSLLGLLTQFSKLSQNYLYLTPELRALTQKGSKF